MNRLHAIRNHLKESGFDGVMITNPENRRYLSGFTGSAGVLLIGMEKAYLITDFRYWEQVRQEVSQPGEGEGFELHKQGPDLWRSVAELIAAIGWGTIGFEATLSYRDYQTVTQAIPHQRLEPMNDLVERLRWTKDETEIERLTKAEAISDAALAKTLAVVRPGVTEKEIALEFDYQLRLHGADGTAFSTIVASGWRAALPHGAPSDKAVARGELLIIDGGALYQGYHGDLTRTFVLGKATEEQREIYRIVLTAQQQALEYLKAGLPGNVVDRVARQVIMDHGHGEHFGHGLGHCVGLNIHENPRLAPADENRIPARAAVTVEPGIYLPDWGGVRIEDLVVVQEDGIVNLTHSPKLQLMEL